VLLSFTIVKMERFASADKHAYVVLLYNSVSTYGCQAGVKIGGTVSVDLGFASLQCHASQMQVA
jgi:hypothetical protein